MNKKFRKKKDRRFNMLFDPYENGICEYEVSFLSSKKNLVNKNNKNDFKNIKLSRNFSNS